MGIASTLTTSTTANGTSATYRPLATYKFVKGDTGPQVKLTFTDEDTGKPADLTGATVTMHFRRKGTTTVLYSRELFVNPDTPKDGTAIIVWQEGDLNQSAGDYEGEIEVVRGSGIRETMFNVLVFQIRADFA